MGTTIPNGPCLSFLKPCLPFLSGYAEVNSLNIPRSSAPLRAA